MTFFCTCSIYVQLCDFCFAIVHESSKRLARLREVCMWLNGYFTSSAAILFVVCCPSSPSSAVVVDCHRRTSSTIAVCSPPLFSSSPATIRVIRRRPAIVVHRRRRLSRSCTVSRGVKILSNICLGPLAPLFHFFIQNASTQFQGNLQQ